MKPCRRTRRSSFANLLLVLLFALAPLSGVEPNPTLAQDPALDVASWELLSPTGWAGRPTTVLARVTSADGLQETSAAYRYSSDGGSGWGEWSGDGLKTTSPVSTTVELEMTIPDLEDSPTENRVQFRIQDTLGAPIVSNEYTLQVDGTAPSSSVSLSPPTPPSGWYNTPVTATISAVDSGGSGLHEIYARLDRSGSFQAGETVVVGASGAHTLEFYSRDIAGNQEAVQTRADYVKVDLEPPTVTATTDKPGPWAEPPVVITLHAADGQGSGIEAVEYRLQGATMWKAGTTITVQGADGTYIYEYRARDRAGNTSATMTISVGLDSGAPGPVTNLTSAPGGWSNDGSGFGLSWDNPEGEQDIAGAWYQIDVDPRQGGTESATPVAGEGIERITGISVSSEGEHTAYLWLEDKAGNKNPYARQVLEGAFKYDATPPNCDEPAIVGSQQGIFYIDEIQVTLAAHDLLSGIGALHYQIEGEPSMTVTVSGGPVTAETTFSYEYPEGRRIISYWATDAAGNSPSVHGSKEVYFDTLAPTSPISITASPEGWSPVQVFNVSWANPIDRSGVAGAYYRVGSPPRWNSDGDYVPGLSINSIPVTVSQQGQTEIYVWLKDGAGLIDHRNRSSVTVKRDATPPVTTIEAEGETRNGYYVEPLTFSFSGTDSLSGVTETWYRIGSGTEQEWDGEPVTLDQEGKHRVTYYSVDEAGNRETARIRDYHIDLHAPQASVWIDGGTDYIRSNLVKLRWGGGDGAGSGIASYKVEYRVGCEPWALLYEGPDTWVDRPIAVTPNYYYYFRVRARDKANYVSEFSEPDAPDEPEPGSYVYYEGLVNGSFESGQYPWWPEYDRLDARRVYTESHTGDYGWVMQLNHDWGVETVPINAHASIHQSIQLPGPSCSEGLVLGFWYRIYTYDVGWGWYKPEDRWTWFDTFEVYVIDAEEKRHLVLRDGEIEDNWDRSRHDLGWTWFAADIGELAQQPIRIEFQVHNRMDDQLPTWVLIDDVQLTPNGGRVVKLPFIGVPGDRLTASSGEPIVEPVQPGNSRVSIPDTKGLPDRRPRRGN